MPRRAPEDLREVLRDFRRDQIIDVARRLFGERGTTDVPMDEIAAEAGVARSTIYVYFANRDELLRACLKRMHTQLLDSIVGDWEGDTRPEPRLRALARAMLERIDDNPAFFRLAVAVQGSTGPAGAAIGTELAAIGLDIARLISDVITDGMAAGTLRSMDADRATALVGQQLYGAMSVRAGDPAPAPLDEATTELCDFLLHGIGMAEVSGAPAAAGGSGGSGVRVGAGPDPGLPPTA